jgi:hypothetical protein
MMEKKGGGGDNLSRLTFLDPKLSKSLHCYNTQKLKQINFSLIAFYSSVFTETLQDFIKKNHFSPPNLLISECNFLCVQKILLSVLELHGTRPRLLDKT